MDVEHVHLFLPSHRLKRRFLIGNVEVRCLISIPEISCSSNLTRDRKYWHSGLATSLRFWVEVWRMDAEHVCVFLLSRTFKRRVLEGNSEGGFVMIEGSAFFMCLPAGISN